MALKERARKREPGRPKALQDPVNVPLRLEREERDVLNMIASEKGMKREELMRRIIGAWLRRESFQ